MGTQLFNVSLVQIDRIRRIILDVRLRIIVRRVLRVKQRPERREKIEAASSRIRSVVGSSKIASRAHESFSRQFGRLVILTSRPLTG